jgi:hypothetical protein
MSKFGQYAIAESTLNLRKAQIYKRFEVNIISKNTSNSTSSKESARLKFEKQKRALESIKRETNNQAVRDALSNVDLGKLAAGLDDDSINQLVAKYGGNGITSNTAVAEASTAVSELLPSSLLS